MTFKNLRDHVLRIAENRLVQPFEEFETSFIERATEEFHKLIAFGWIKHMPPAESNTSDTDSNKSNSVEDKVSFIDNVLQQVEQAAEQVVVNDIIQAVEHAVAPKEIPEAAVGKDAKSTDEKGSEIVSKSSGKKTTKKIKEQPTE